MLVGDKLLTMLRGAALVKASSGNDFPRKCQEIPEIITSTSAELSDISGFQCCTGHFLSSELRSNEAFQASISEIRGPRCDGLKELTSFGHLTSRYGSCSRCFL